jgi:hypothetical protein
MKRSLLIVVGSLFLLAALVPANDKEQPKKEADKKEPAKTDADKTPPGPLPIDKLLAKNKELVPALITRLTDPDAQVRQTSAYILANVGKDALPGLTAAMGDKDPEMRANAAYVLGAMGKLAQDAMPVLVVALKDENPDVRQRAAYAIQRILSESPLPVPPVQPGPPMPPATDEPKKTEPKKTEPNKEEPKKGESKDKSGAAATPGVIPASYTVPRMAVPNDPGLAVRISCWTVGWRELRSVDDPGLVLPSPSGKSPAPVPDFLKGPDVPGGRF